MYITTSSLCSLLEHFIKCSPQDDASDLICPSPYLIELGITEKSTSGVVINVAIAPWRREEREKGRVCGQREDSAMISVCIHLMCSCALIWHGIMLQQVSPKYV